MERPLRGVMFAGEDGLLDQTAYTQPALLAVAVALFRLVESWGVRPGFLGRLSIGAAAMAPVVPWVLSCRTAEALCGQAGRLVAGEDGEPGAGVLELGLPVVS
ncbi:hypothetical protein, partial [Saccharothrix sp. ST-888]|uniref:hypothetical protein n=1 Tax=Saccharothrix sp. ST-888 TaxID=1427391 RepID=UPI0012E0A508